MAARHLRSPEAALFVLALGVYAYFFQAGGWNQNVRFDLVRAIVEEHTIVIDDYADNTGDFSVYNHHIFSDKAPGVSWLCVPVWASVHAVLPEGRPRGRHIDLGAYLSTVFAIGLTAAAAVAVLYRVALRFGARPAAAAVLALAWAFGTLALPYSTLLYGHQLAAALLLVAFWLLVGARDEGRPAAAVAVRLFVTGASLGYAVATEYPVALPVAVLGLYATAVVRPWPRLLWIAAGAAGPLAALALYHASAFGGPLTVGYSFHTDPARAGGLLLGVNRPDVRLLGPILFSESRGLVHHAPWLALALPGGLLLLRTPELRREAVACLALMATGLWFNASLTNTPTDWQAGSGIGTRHLIATLPFYVLCLVGFVRGRAPGFLGATAVRWAAVAVFAGLLALSTWRMLLATAVHPETIRLESPFEEEIYPLWSRGEVAVNRVTLHTGGEGREPAAWNLGQKMGLTGRASLLPLAGFAILGTAWLAYAVRDRARASAPR